MMKKKLLLLHDSLYNRDNIVKKSGATIGETLTGSVVFSSVFALNSAGNINLGGSVNILNTHTLNSQLSALLAGSSTISNVYSLSPRGNMVFGFSYQDEEFIIKTQPTTLTNIYTLDVDTSSLKFGATSLTLPITMNFGGSVVYTGNLVLNNNYNVEFSAQRDIGGLLSLLHEYDASFLLNAVLSGETEQTLNFDLTPFLTSTNDSISNLLFILNIVRSKNFNLNIRAD